MNTVKGVHSVTPAWPTLGIGMWEDSVITRYLPRWRHRSWLRHHFDCFSRMSQQLRIKTNNITVLLFPFSTAAKIRAVFFQCFTCQTSNPELSCYAYVSDATASRPTLVPTRPPIYLTQGAPFSRVRRPECKANHSPTPVLRLSMQGGLPPLLRTPPLPGS
jgi:hypothetical protein